jgi:sec-independent protein translocase protein TatB
MFFDIGWPEFLLIGIVALVVIGPKDLPRAMRVAGYWLGRARTLSREFHSSVDQMIREAELDEVRRELNKATQFDLEAELHQTVDPDGNLAHSIKAPSASAPDFFDEGLPAAIPGLGASALLAAPTDMVAPEAPLPPGMPEPEFVGFEPPGLSSGDAPPTAAAAASPKP